MCLLGRRGGGGGGREEALFLSLPAPGQPFKKPQTRLCSSQTPPFPPCHPAASLQQSANLVALYQIKPEATLSLKTRGLFPAVWGPVPKEAGNPLRFHEIYLRTHW